MGRLIEMKTRRADLLKWRAKEMTYWNGGPIRQLIEMEARSAGILKWRLEGQTHWNGDPKDLFIERGA